MGYGLGIELVQGLLAFRQASALDFAADTLGVALWHGLRFAVRQGRPGSKASG